jgi:lysyl-tRNA synthetase class II
LENKKKEKIINQIKDKEDKKNLIDKERSIQILEKKEKLNQNQISKILNAKKINRIIEYKINNLKTKLDEKNFTVDTFMYFKKFILALKRRN